MIGKNLVIGLIATLLALATGVFVGMKGFESKNTEPTISAKTASWFLSTRLNDETGAAQPLEQWRGKVLVVNFWAAWCQPCRQEMPAFTRLQEKYSANGVQFVGIALDSAENVTQFKKAVPVNYPLLIAEKQGSELTQQLGNTRLALPYTVIFGKQGEVHKIKLGLIQEQELDSILHSVSKP